MTVYAGQYGPEFALNASGQLLVNTAFTVTNPVTQAVSTLYTDRTKATMASNPGSTTSLGNLIFFADPGQYNVTCAASTLEVSVQPDPAEPSAGLTPIIYNTGGGSWPARPSTSVVAAGYAMYISASASAANPGDMQIGDTLFIPTTTSAPSFTAASPPNGIVSTAYSYTFTASNNPTSFAIASGTIPAGTTFNTSTGVLSGTPTTATAYTFTISATNSAGTVTTASITVTINASSNTLTYSTTATTNWTPSNATVAVDSTNTHTGAHTLAVTQNLTGQNYNNIAQAFAVTAGLSYSVAATFAVDLAGTANRQGRYQLFFQTSGFATVGSTTFGAATTLTSSWQSVAGVSNVVAPATAAFCVVVLLFQSTDGSNLSNAEVVNWSAT